MCVDEKMRVCLYSFAFNFDELRTEPGCFSRFISSYFNWVKIIERSESSKCLEATSVFGLPCSSNCSVRTQHSNVERQWLSGCFLIESYIDTCLVPVNWIGRHFYISTGEFLTICFACVQVPSTIISKYFVVACSVCVSELLQCANFNRSIAWQSSNTVAFGTGKATEAIFLHCMRHW